MKLDIEQLKSVFPDLIPTPITHDRGEIAYRLRLPVFTEGREFEWAELRLPNGFPEEDKASIHLSPDAILRIPHVEALGKLCLGSDPGPGSGSPENRILWLLWDYQETFLVPWLQGDLDGDFVKEPLNYWDIHVRRHKRQHDAVKQIWTLDERQAKSRLCNGLLLQPIGIVVVSDNHNPVANKIINSLGLFANQRINVRVAEISIDHMLTPMTWPLHEVDLRRILTCRLSQRDQNSFFQCDGRRGHEVHRIVLLRHTVCAFAFLFPGGPPTTITMGRRRRAYPPSTKPQPLSVIRVDVSWIVGRDQHPQVRVRQSCHVVVFGGGALGSHVVEQLAKAGVGHITLIDPEAMEPANLGRHLLGLDACVTSKAKAVADMVNKAHPHVTVTPCEMNAKTWLKTNKLAQGDLVLDLTGDGDVRWQVEQARALSPCPLLIGWMEPYVAAAHVCMLPAYGQWMQGTIDPMGELQAVEWPSDVIQQVPGCSSSFQSYTSAAAAHAVALVSERALQMIDSGLEKAEIVSWVRGQRYLDRHWQGLSLREWAKVAEPYDGTLLERAFP
jgi:hypothetical protein